MALGAVAAAALTNHAARTWGLYVDGLDVGVEADGAPSYGTDPRSLALHLAGPGGASSLSWVVDDPQKVLGFLPGAEVRFEVFTVAGPPWFRGTLEVIEGSPDFGMQGRTWRLTATGDDALPDWVVTDYALTFTGTYLATDMVQAIIAACSNRGELRAGVDSILPQGSQELPIGNLGGAANLALPASITVAIAAGTTLRAAVNQVIAACGVFDLTLGARFTVDTLRGVRLWQVKDPLQGPDGDTTVTVGPASTPGADNAFRTDATSVVRQAIVRGAAGVSGRATDGSGRRGRSIVVTDLSLTTAEACQAVAIAALRGTAIRGSIRVESSTTLDESVMRSKLGLTDAATGATGTYEVGGADVTFDKLARATVQIAYGGRPASAADLIRRLTRDALS